MSNVFKDRSIRQQTIKKGLQFIQSPLPYPGTQQHYEIFLQDLVRNLFNEGNYLYRDGDWNAALNQYTEALNIADYASSEEICISRETIEKLHVNRAACYTDMGCHDKVLEDCIAALSLNDGNFRALYRKAQAFCELGRHKEAYDVAVKCSLAVPQDGNVIKLTQELAKKLGLKIRKAYVRAKPPANVLPGEEVFKCSGCSAEDIEPDIPELSHDSVSSVSSQSPLSLTHEGLSESAPIPVSSLSPGPYPLVEKGSFPSASFMNGGHTPFPVPESCLDYGDGDILGEDLDNLLDSAPESADSGLSSTIVRGPIPTSSTVTGLCFPSNLLGTLPARAGFVSSVSLSEMYPPPLTSLDNFCSLNSLSISESQRDLTSLISRDGGPTRSSNNSSRLRVNGANSLFVSESSRGVPNDSSNDFSTYLGSGVTNASVSGALVIRNPLENTHEFRQACQVCFIKSGPKLLDFIYHPNVEHICKKDILLGRIKTSEEKSWKRVRPRPTKTQYVGPFYICKDVAAEEECKYPGHCTFAYCQEEIDVWTLERKGAFSRETLFGGIGKNNLTIPRLLQEHHGIFMFLCEKCFDHKPRIISKGNKDNPAYCSHPVSKHDFEDSKCLVHILQDTTVKYSKIRSFSSQYQLDLCRHEVRYGCLREDECFYAHSLVELMVWMMQKETGISLDILAQESRKLLHSVEIGVPGLQIHGCQKKDGSQKLKIKFVCAQCWRNGQVIEPDKQKKYCSAKARHPWNKDRRVVLVMSIDRKKWMAVRPMPTKKPVPLQFDLCNHIATGKKCQYIGNCSFAHSPEEKEMWTYMRDNVIQDMEQLYEMWLKSQKTEKGEDSAALANKQIHMPTDYAETTVDFHCWLCGKNCNSERQWKQHLFSEKHKEKVFHSEEDQNFWQHRFPTGCFSICERYMSGTCFDGDNCKFAHGSAELKEWEDRRQVLKLKLSKARKDQLVAPNDNDFGKYSFLIKDLN